MAIIICPTLTDLTEFEMCSSERFRSKGHEPFSIQLRNHDKQHKTTLADEYILPDEVTLDSKSKKYRKRVNTNHEIKMKISNINPIGGIEALQKHLNQKHKNIPFYVLELVTHTTGRVRHTCVWRRKPASASNSGIVSLHLTHINDKKALDHYSQEEMWEIVGRFPDDKCRLRTEMSQKVVIVCDPVTR